MAKAGSWMVTFPETDKSVLAGFSSAFRLAASNAAIHSMSSFWVSAWSMMLLLFVFTSKQNRRSSWKAGRILQSKTPILSLSSTPPVREPCTRQPKIPFFKKAQRLTQFVRVGLPESVRRYTHPCFSGLASPVMLRDDSGREPR
jgi:hypothetical protein